jgi:zinc protease
MTLRRSAAILGALSLLSASATALAATPPIKTHECPNGLDVIVVENHSVPLVTVEIAAKNGSFTEPPEYSGLSHLYEHMFFKANAVLPNQTAYMARLRELGIVFNGTTSTERVNYFFTTTSDKTEGALVFMRDAITSPIFDQAELERERVVVTGEMDRNEASPFYHFHHEIDRRVWFKHPTRKDPLGSRKTVLEATTAKMKTIQERYYVPNNSVLVVTGDVKAEEIFARADTLFAKWAKGPDPFIKNPIPKHPALTKSEVVIVEQPNVQSFVGRFVWHGPSTIDGELDATYAADALGTAIDEPSSKFQKALVDSGACVSAGWGWYTQRHTGPISLEVQATPDKIDACLAAAKKEIDAMADPSYVTPAELADAAHTLELSQVKAREKPSELAHILTFWWAVASLDYYEKYVDNIRKVTPQATSKVVTTWMKGKPFVFGGLVSPEMSKAGATPEHIKSIVGAQAIHKFVPPVKAPPKKDEPKKDAPKTPAPAKKAEPKGAK